MDKKEKIEFLKQKMANMPKCEHKNVRWQKAIKADTGFLLIGICNDCHQTIYGASEHLPSGLKEVKK